MKSLVAAALVALGLIATTVAAQAGSHYEDYPQWAQRAFENS
jgi:hypothetical protein